MNSIIIKSIYIIAFVFSIHSLPAQDLRIADSALKIYHNSSNISDSDNLKLVYKIAKNHTNSDSALLYSKLLIDFAKKNKNGILLLKGNYYCGLAYTNKGVYAKALEAFFACTEVANLIKCDAYKSAAYIAIADVYSASFNSKNAIFYYNKALHISKIENDTISIASVYLNAGSEYLILNKLDSALIYFAMAEKLFAKLENHIGVAYSMGNIGKVLSKKGRLTNAEQNITKAIAILEKYKDSYALSIDYMYLSDIYKKRKDITSALALAEISLSIAQQSKLLPQVMDAFKLLTELHAIEGNLDKAFECQSNYITTRDSINNEATIRKMADLRTEYEIAQKQTEVDLLNKKRQNQQIILISLLAILLLTIGLFVVLYTNTRKRKTLHNKLLKRKEELQTQRDEFEKLNNTKDRFFSIISHDLRGPIGVLNGTTMLIRDFLDSKNYDELEELTSNMEYTVKKVQVLLDNLLEWAVSQQGEFPYKPEEIEMDEICDNVLNIFIAMAATKSIELTYEIKPNAKYVFADRNSLLTIMRNLISNALKFTNKDGAVSILAEVKNGKYCILVDDTGVGIPKEKLDYLFTINEKKSTWGTAKEKGLGLGLSLVYEFVKMNKGEITVDSTVDGGTLFTICLPFGIEQVKILAVTKKENSEIASMA